MERSLARASGTLVGPGAVGLYYGAALIRSGRRLRVLARSDAGTLRENGIVARRVDPASGDERERFAARPDAIETDPERLGPCDWVLIAAKSTANDALPGLLRPLVDPGNTLLVTLQNGLGNGEWLARHFPRNPVVVGLCFVCLNRVSPGVAECYSPGQVDFGSVEDRWPAETRAVRDAFADAGIKARLAPSLNEALWRKLCWNIPFNGLAIAAGGWTTDRILADPETAGRARRLMDEVRAVAHRQGIEIGDAFLDRQFEATERMGAYRPSSLIDFENGKPVEIEAIWSVPQRRGRALGCDLPELARLEAEIRDRVARRDRAGRTNGG